MINQTRRDPWRTIWQIATSDYLMAALVLGTAAGLAIVVWLPQMPTADPVAYARWLSEAQARFGNATPTLQTLGLFTVMRSIGFRALLALLAGGLLLRLIESGDRLQQHRQMATPAGEWRVLADVHLPEVMDALRRQRYRVLSAPPLFQADRWPWADLFPWLAQGGALVFLSGLLVTYLWGWQVTGLIVQSGEQVTLPGTAEWVALNGDTCRTTHSSGVVTFVEQCGPGVQANATDNTGQPLPLQQTANADPVTQLTVPLTEDQYFAIPQAQLIVRLTPQPGYTVEAHSPVLVQVYHSPPGRLVTETVVESAAELTVDHVTLTFASVPYARMTVTSNPGLWPTGVGLVLVGVGTLGSIAWPVRRFWLRKETERIEGAGDLLPMLARTREA
jgi:cytochrome c biogenesis protein ResB